MSTGAQAVGLCATDLTSISSMLNEACERLINDPLAPDEGWFGGWARMAFTVTNVSTAPSIVTPQGIARIILMDVCKYPVKINNEFFEFLEFGRGFQPFGCTTTPPYCGCGNLNAYERENVVTFTALLPTPQIIRAYAADPSDVGRTALVQGKDSNGQIVRYIDALSGASALGEKITLSSPFVDGQNLFSEITGLQKQKTFGEVQFFQVDPTSGAETSLLVMQPWETTALYRTYYVRGLPSSCCNVPGGTVQVLAMCKLDFIPVSSDSDYLPIMSIPALIDECMSIRLGRMDTAAAQQLSANKHLSALRILFGQLDHMLGKQNVAIQRHIFGSDPLRLQPL